MPNKAEVAIVALNDAAEAYDQLPDAFKTPPQLFGRLVSSDNLRQEANAIQERYTELAEIYAESEE